MGDIAGEFQFHRRQFDLLAIAAQLEHFFQNHCALFFIKADHFTNRSNAARTIAEAFDLHQTDGFLIELTEAFAVREGLTVDRTEFNRLMDKHRKDSGSGAFDASVMKAGPLDTLRANLSGTEFLGYEAEKAEGTPRLLVHARCTTLRECLARYHYARDKPGSLDPVKDGFDHAVDALRYLVLNLDRPGRAVMGEYAG